MRYAIKRIKMKEVGTDEFLTRLQTRLKDRALPPQDVIASAIDTDQPFISRAKSGSLKRVTARVRRLDAYLSRHASTSANLAATDVTVSGSIKNRSETRRRTKRQREEREATLARKSCDAYLSEGYNPRVLIDQIDLLRQAQSRMR